MKVDEAIEYLNSLLALAKKLPSGELRIQDEEIETIETLIKGYEKQQKRLLKKDKKISDKIKEIDENELEDLKDQFLLNMIKLNNLK